MCILNLMDIVLYKIHLLLQRKKIKILKNECAEFEKAIENQKSSNYGAEKIHELYKKYISSLKRKKISDSKKNLKFSNQNGYLV